MKRLPLFAVLLWLCIAFGSANAAPPSYQDLQANLGAVPMQPTWQLRPVDASTPPWKDIFTFTLGIAPDPVSYTHLTLPTTPYV